MYGQFRCVVKSVKSVKPEQQNQLEQWDQSNEYSDIITCMNIEMYYVFDI